MRFKLQVTRLMAAALTKHWDRYAAPLHKGDNKMATKKKVSTPTGGHTPISSLSKEAAEATTPTTTVSRPPSEGVNPKTPKAREDGSEGVKGFKLKLTETAMAEA